VKNTMENPILVFRRDKGWSRAEFQKRSGISYQTLRNLETGETRKISDATMQYLTCVGISTDIQARLDEWREKQQEYIRNEMKNGKA
jgi:transcriptional regulator with XRE-family HTH domain